MKLNIITNQQLTEPEIDINCSYIDKPLQKIINYITQYTFTIEGESEGKHYQLPLDKIYYIESVDSKTYLYSKNHSFSCKAALSTLEDQLVNTPFVRISKNCLLNTTYLKCVELYPNHRLKAELTNDEHIIISRNYIADLKNKIKH